MQLSKREHIALELLKNRSIAVNEAYKLADQFIELYHLNVAILLMKKSGLHESGNGLMSSS